MARSYMTNFTETEMNYLAQVMDSLDKSGAPLLANSIKHKVYRALARREMEAAQDARQLMKGESPC